GGGHAPRRSAAAGGAAARRRHALSRVRAPGAATGSAAAPSPLRAVRRGPDSGAAAAPVAGAHGGTARVRQRSPGSAGHMSAHGGARTRATPSYSAEELQQQWAFLDSLVERQAASLRAGVQDPEEDEPVITVM